MMPYLTWAPRLKEEALSTTTQPLGTVIFNRKVQVRPYESAEAGIYLQFELPDMNGDREGYGKKVLEQIQDAFMQAKAAVFDELGIEFSVDEGGVVREVIREAFGQVTEVVSSPQAKQVAAAKPELKAVSAPSADEPPYDPSTTDKGEIRENRAWAKARIETHPDEFWDNREKKASGQYKENAADFKHKDTGISVWLS